MSRIHLTIDKLVLHGFDDLARRAFVASLRSELATTFANPASHTGWTHSHNIPILRLGQMALESSPAGAGKLGKQVARAIGRGLKS